MKKFIYLVAFIAVLVTSCSKPPVEVKLPASTASLTSSFFYPRTTTVESVFYSSKNDSSIIVKGLYNSDKDLVIDFDVKYALGKDGVSLILAKDKIRTGLTGDYIISPFLTAGMPQGDI